MQHPAPSEIFAAKIWPFSNLIQHHSTSCNMWQHFATGWSKVCNIAHNNIARCYVEMLHRPCWCLVPFSLILFEIVTFLYDTIDFNLSSLPLLPNVSTVHTLNLLLSSIAALVFRALWFNPTLIVNMYRTHFEFNSHLVSCVSFSSRELNLFCDCWYSNSCTSGWILFAMSQLDCLHVI